MSNTKAAVAAMMKLPKAERLERLVAMSAECVARQEDAAPLLSLIQLELDTPDELEDERAPASRPVSSASTSASGPLAPPPKAKSTRRLLKEKRDELRAMLAKVDGALGNNSGGGSSRQNSRDGASQQSTRPDAVAFAHMSRGEKLQLARQSGYRGGAAAASAQGRSSSAPLVEVPEHIKERFKDEYEADPQAFRRTWSEQTPEFRRLCSLPEPSRTATPKLQQQQRQGTASRGGGGDDPSGRTRKPLDDAAIEALLRKAQGGGKAPVGDARAASSSFSF
jgi:hypothetical protein